MDVVYLVHHLLEKEPASRPPSARAVADELKRVREKHYPDFVPGRPEGWSLADSTDGTNLLPRPPGR